MSGGVLPFGSVIDAVGGSRRDMVHESQESRGSRDSKPEERTDGMGGSIDLGVFPALLGVIEAS